MTKINVTNPTPQDVKWAVLYALGFPPGTNLELDMDKVHLVPDGIELDPGFIKSLSVEVLVSETDGVHDDPEVYYTEDELYKSFTEWTGCSKEEYTSGQYDNEHNEGLIVRLYTIPVKKEADEA